MKILIISFGFPPYNNIASVRVGKMAKYLVKFGHEVKVISARNDPVLCSQDLEIPAEDVIYTKWLGIAPENLNINALDFLGGSKRLYSVMRKCWRVFKGVFYFPDVFIGWIPYLIGAANKTVRAWRPDIICVSAGPHSSLIAASHVAAKFKIPWLADLRDLWTDNQCYAFGKIRKGIERKIESNVLSSAAGLVTVSEPLAQKLRSRFRNPVEVVCNGFDPGDYDLLSSSVNISREGELRIVYTGTIYDGFQDPSPLFSALKNFSKDEVRVVFYGAYRPYFRNLVKKMGVEDRVEINSLVPYKESLYIQKNADILLFLTWSNPEEKGFYSGKLFEYMGAGRPILGIGPDVGVAADLIKERSLGVVLNSQDGIYEQLKQWLGEKKGIGFISSLPVKARDGFSREEQTRKLEKFMQKIVGGA